MESWILSVIHFSFTNSDKYNIKIGGFVAEYYMWGQKMKVDFKGPNPHPILMTTICIFIAPFNQGLLNNFVNIIKAYRLLYIYTCS